MRILIGIYQDQEEANTLYQQKDASPSSVTEVGPFFSKDQALSWMDHLSSKIRSCEKVPVPQENGADTPWHGFTIEDLDN